MKKYSVLLLIPDAVAHKFGDETFYRFIEAVDVRKAVIACQEEADDYYGTGDPDEFRLLSIVAGHRPLLNVWVKG